MSWLAAVDGDEFLSAAAAAATESASAAAPIELCLIATLIADCDGLDEAVLMVDADELGRSSSGGPLPAPGSMPFSIVVGGVWWCIGRLVWWWAVVGEVW